MTARGGLRLAALILVAGGVALAAAPPAPRILSLKVFDAIQPVTASYLVEGIRKAEEERFALLLIQLDTPGGLMSSTEKIVEAITRSPVPVVVFVSGTHAASAGFFITISADVAVMAPGTRFGAAHPVALFGGDGKRPEAEPMFQKIENDAAAWVRTLAENRKRNVSLAEEAVRESRAFTEQEALKGGLIDYVLPDEASILQTLDGKSIRRFQGKTETLQLEGAQIHHLRMTARERFQSWILQPAVLIFLLLAGAAGLYVEFTHPGLIFPGVAGAIALLCFAWATQILPVNYAGLLLILLGILLFILEIKVVSHGLLTTGGIGCLVAGGLLLFRKSEAEGLDVPLWTVGSVSLAAALLMAFLSHRVIWAHRQRVTTGEEGLIGEIGEAVSDLAPEGKVFVHGETWNARGRRPAPRGSRVKVVRVVGMMLEVDILRPPEAPPGGEGREA